MPHRRFGASSPELETWSRRTHQSTPSRLLAGITEVCVHRRKGLWESSQVGKGAEHESLASGQGYVSERATHITTSTGTCLDDEKLGVCDLDVDLLAIVQL